MCGIVGMFGAGWQAEGAAMLQALQHRGPDDVGLYEDRQGRAILGHTRLSIIDRSAAGHQPMPDASGTRWLAFNGEIYNYVELRRELADYPFRSSTDTEVILAAYDRWGEACLDKLYGMFAFLLWDSRSGQLFAARDRFGVKPLYYRLNADGRMIAASEIKAIQAAGEELVADESTWATYLAYGNQDWSSCTFWSGVRSLPPGHYAIWQDGGMRVSCWYDLAARVGNDYDDRSAAKVMEEYSALLQDSIRLRFRSDVPVGISLSGGLDSSLLLGLVQKHQGSESDIKAYTFLTGDPNYDELPWVRQMLAQTRHPLVPCLLRPEEVPELAQEVQAAQDEPYGGLPTIAYARLFEIARSMGTIVLLDGQGMDEQWAGYDYYLRADEPAARPALQGSKDLPVRSEVLLPEFLSKAKVLEFAAPFPDQLRNQQYRDIRHTKLPRALRYNDRVSMMSSTELREPFLDHRLMELAVRQPRGRKIGQGQGKKMLRDMAAALLPGNLATAPKRPVQTPQREWLRGPLREWATETIETALHGDAQGWLRPDAVRALWRQYCEGQGDNSYYIWQWISLGMLGATRPSRAAYV